MCLSVHTITHLNTYNVELKKIKLEMKAFSSTEVSHLPSLSFILQRLMALVMLKQVYESALFFSKYIQFHQFVTNHDFSVSR